MAVLERIDIEVSSKIEGLEGIREVTSSLNFLKETVANLNIDKIRNLDVIFKEIGESSGTATYIKDYSKNITSLSNSFDKLSSINNIDFNSFNTNITGVITGLRNINEATQGINFVKDFSSNITKLSNSFKKIIDMDIEKVADKMKAISAALKPLTDEMNRGSHTVVAYATVLSKLAPAATKANTAISKLGSNKGLLSLGQLPSTLLRFAGITSIAQTISGSIQALNSYVENANLFTVALGENVIAAQKFIDEVSGKLGIDPADMMRNFGLFQQLTTSFGVAEKQAYTLSKTMTQLGYDISSFYNIPVEDAFLKLQSGIVGELEPLRRLGYDLSQARLQQELYSLGIQKSVVHLTQADKAILRYNAILKQSTNVMGDLSRTLMTPANAIRVLQSQFAILSREFGSVFIPILMKVIPYLIAIVRLAGLAFKALAQLLGFKMTTIDYSSLTDRS